MANNCTEVVPFIVVYHNVGAINGCIINNHRAAFNTNVPLAFFSERRCSECRRGKRQSHREFTHRYNPL